MTITKHTDGKNLTLALEGRLDTTTAPELEAELKSGDSQILDQWCQTLATKFSLTPEPASKFARAYALMGGNHA